MTLTADAPVETLPMTRTRTTNAGRGCACGGSTGDQAYLCPDCVRELADDLHLLAPAATEVPNNARWERDHEHRDGQQVRDAAGKLIPVTYGRQTTTRWDIPVGSKAGLIDHLELAESRQVRIGAAAGGDRPVIFNERAAEIRGALDQQLRPWAVWLAAQAHAQHADRLAAAPLPAVVAYLAEHVEQIRHNPSAGQLAHAVADAVKTIQKVIDRPGKQRYGGPCGADRPDGVLCDTPLYADEGDRDFVCPTCHTSWAVDERQAWLRDLAADQLATAPAIAAAFAREPDDQADEEPKEFRRLLNRIYQWAKRDRLTARGELRGQPLYRVGDIDDLMKAYEQRGDRRGGRRERTAR